MFSSVVTGTQLTFRRAWASAPQGVPFICILLTRREQSFSFLLWRKLRKIINHIVRDRPCPPCELPIDPDFTEKRIAPLLSRCETLIYSLKGCTALREHLG